MKKKNNAAIYLLSSRTKLLEECLINLYKNWNYNYDYPVYVHHFDNIYSDKFIRKINKTISEKIFFKKVNYSIPKFIDESELFYNRKYLKYVRESFSKRRIGYLHMEHFVINITSFGETGCLTSELSNYQKLMRIDDDSYFKSKIDFDLFDVLDDYPFATGYTWTKYDYRVKDTRENLWSFYKNYIKKNNIIPKNQKLKEAIERDNEEAMHNLDWSAGNLNLYNMDYFKNETWLNFLKAINNYGGAFKHRWGDIPCIGLYSYTFFEKPLFNFNLIQKGLYDNKFPSILSSTAPSINSYFNVHNFFILRWYHAIKKLLK